MADYTAQAKYDKANTMMISIKLNKNTDSDIIERLGKETSRQGYIKELIRNDIKK